MTPELEQKLRELASEIWVEAYERGYAAGMGADLLKAKLHYQQEQIKNATFASPAKPADVIRRDEPEATYWNDPRLIWNDFEYLIDPDRDNDIVGIARAGESRYSLTLLIKDGNVMMTSSVADKYGKSTELLRTSYTPATSTQQHKYQCEKHLRDLQKGNQS